MRYLSLGYMTPLLIRHVNRLVCYSFLIAILPSALISQWTTDCRINTSICTAIGEQTAHQIISDGAGGAIIAWYDQRNGTNGSLYAQHVNAFGLQQWSHNGEPIINVGQQFKLVSDGAGGIILCWIKSSGGKRDLLMQRVNSEGLVQWPADGISVSDTTSPDYQYSIISDGSGGVFISWASNGDIYAQRVKHDGSMLWDIYTPAICTEAGVQSTPCLVGDGTGGVIISWADKRRGESSDIYAQHVYANGYRAWQPNGVLISAGTNGVAGMIGDGAGGAILLLNGLTQPSTAPAVIGVQRVDASGNVQWTANGLVIRHYSSNIDYPAGRIISDNAGGVIILWSERIPHGITASISIQHVTATGVLQWPTEGVPVHGHNSQSSYDVIGDNAGGIIAAWSDYNYRDNTNHIYAQRVNTSGVTQWIELGMPVCMAEGRQEYPHLVGDGETGAFIVWQDSRNGYADLYAQNIDASGHLGLPPTLVEVRDVPNDQGGQVHLLWDHSQIDAPAYPDAEGGYEIYRGVTATSADKKFEVLSEKAYLSKKTGHVPCPFYLTNGAVAADGAPIYWEFIDDIKAQQLEHYSAVVPTLCDSGPQGNSQFYYMVRAYTSPTVYWDSQPDSGYSVDNLAPVGVASLSASLLPDATVKIHWPPNTRDPDVCDYVIYRSSSNGFIPDEATLLAESTDTSFVDTAPSEALAVYYRVLARDIHGNLGKPSPEVSVSLAVTRTYTVPADWNMISVPLAVTDAHKSILFPTSVSDAFTYQSAYIIQNTLENGVGYWLKFPTGQSLSMTGAQRTRDTLDLVMGWNMIGSLSNPVDIGNIIQIPSGIVTSPYYGYSGSGYEMTTSINPMDGYWVKVSEAGRLVLTNGISKQHYEDPRMALGQLNRLFISDAQGRERVLYYAEESSIDPARYELPPLPGSGCFDARYETESMVAKGQAEISVHLTGALYPLTITWKNVTPTAAVLIIDGRETPMQMDGSIKVNTLRDGIRVRLSGTTLPTEYALEQNYPNPFNPSTTIRYALPAPSYVKLEVYNALGALVAVLADGVQEAGYKTAEFHATGLASGVYLYRLQTGPFTSTKKFVLLH